MTTNTLPCGCQSEGWCALHGTASEQRAAILHARDAGPGYRDEDDQLARLVTCPDCGQLEWWTERELSDHGQCRSLPDGVACGVC